MASSHIWSSGCYAIGQTSTRQPRPRQSAPSGTAKVAVKLSSRPISGLLGSKSPSHLVEDEEELFAIERQINKIKGTSTERSLPASQSCQL